MCVYVCTHEWEGAREGEREKGEEEERVRHPCGSMSITCVEIRGQFSGFSSSKEGYKEQTLYKRSIDIHC